MYKMSKDPKQLIKDMLELEETEGWKELKKYLNLEKETLILDLINIKWIDHDIKYSAHDVNRRSLEFIDKLLNLPWIIIEQKEEKETNFDDINVI